MRKNGAKKFLQPFLDDMIKAQSGVQLNVRGDKRIWHGILGNVVGDMPASNVMGGFKESGSANRPCRVCHVLRHDCDNIHDEKDYELRERTTYKTQLSRVVDVNLTSHERHTFSVEYGIVGPRPFFLLDYFDSTKCFPHDIMHVFFEGLLNSETRLLLVQLINDDIIPDVDVINSRMELFRSRRGFTKPAKIRLDEIKHGKKLSFSSSKMLCLPLILPLILSEYCSIEDNTYYTNYFLQVEVATSMCCYSFSEMDLNC